VATNEDDDNELTLPRIDDDVVSSGAAADSASAGEKWASLPRILRYAYLATTQDSRSVHKRLVAEIAAVRPHLPPNATWAETPDVGLAIALANELDRLAVAKDQTELRSLADSVRLLSLPVALDVAYFGDHRRVAKALLLALRNLPSGINSKLLVTIEEFCAGWAAMPCGTDLITPPTSSLAARGAASLGRKLSRHRVELTKASVWNEVRAQQKNEAEFKDDSPTEKAAPEVLLANHLVVAKLDEAQIKNIKLKEIIAPLKHAINVALPLVTVPPLQEVRRRLQFEFPYAVDVVDFALADLVGRTTVMLRPLLIVGPPGGGKSRFSRRLGECLGLHVWRSDAARADGATFGGTDRRWNSAEPCHPFMAIAQARQANPLVLIDEIEKAATRSDYGRLWDTLLGFLESETNARYPDPALQVTIDLSHVSYVATANSFDALPSPIRDRFRIVDFPKPTAADLDALLPAVIADLTQERGLDSRWVVPLDTVEYSAIAGSWRGGSIRRLRRIIEVVLRERERMTVRN
jgi:ATP-dependent Lon protease